MKEAVLEKGNQLIAEFEKVLEQPLKRKGSRYYTGVDLGTAFVVMVVLDQDGTLVAGAYRGASVVKDGMVVDYIGALQIVREMKEELEAKLETELVCAAAAIPPGTAMVDGGVVRNVVEGAGFEVIAMAEESTAANEVLEISNGAVVDVGGGTTGITIFADGKPIDTRDEATGGTHLSLVIAGAYKISYEEAEEFKRDPRNHKELLATVNAVIDKIGIIISNNIKGYDVPEIYLVGGTCCFSGIEQIIERRTGIPTYKPRNPLFVTPIGIAFSCFKKAGE